MLPLHLKSVQGGPRNLPLKVGKHCVSNSWDIADIEFVVGGGAGGASVQSHFYVKPNVRLG